MKKIYFTTFLLLFMTSCSDSFINLQPTSSVSVDVMYKTDNDYKDALTAVYYLLQSQYQNMYIIGDLRADDSYQEINKSNSQSYSDLFTTSSSDVLMNNTWSNYYRAVYRLNVILNKIEDMNSADIPNKDHYIGEAKFLRALIYFDLVRIFGDVPMIINPLSIEESLHTGREPLTNIYDKVIIPDLLVAEKILPSKYSGSDIGRPTKGAAKAILGRVFITIKRFDEAEKKLEEVTTLGYSLLENYNDVFNYEDEHHSEYIFDIEYEEGVGEGSVFTHHFLPNFQKFTEFHEVGGWGDEHNNPSDELIELFEENDLRKDVTVGIKGGFYGEDSVFYNLPANTNQSYTKKYITPTASQNDSKANWRIVRYADVLLMYAEALNENNKTAEAIDYLNQIRTRAGLAEHSKSLSKTEAREAIYLERRLELSFEGVRWFDLVRTGRAYEVMKEFGMQEYMTVWPIPISQIDIIGDPAIFPQNPGY